MTRALPRVAFWIVLAVTVFLFFFRLGDRSFRNPDEGRYAEIAVEMVKTGDWVEPQLYGVGYLRKPILFYWLVAASFKIFGFSEWAARFVPVGFGVLGVLITFFFTRRVFDQKTAFIASLVLATNVLYLQIGRYLLIDMVFSFFLVAALYLFYLATHEAKHKTRFYELFYLCIGLAFLTKGLAAVAIVGFVCFVYLTLTGQWTRTLREMYLGRGIVIFLAIVLPWFVQISLRRPDFLNFFFIHEHFQRYLSSHFEHQEAWYYYLWLTPVMLIPWIFFPEPLVRSLASLNENRWRNPRFFLLFCALAVVLFYSLSTSKLMTYILPALPFFSILIATGWVGWQERVSEKSSEKLSMVMSGIFFGVSLVFLVAAPWVVPHVADRSVDKIIPFLQQMAGLLAVAGGAGFFLLRAKRVRAFFYTWIIVLSALSIVVSDAMKTMNSNYTTKAFAQFLKPRLQENDRVFIYDHPGALYDFRYYLDFPVKLVGMQGELELFKDDPRAKTVSLGHEEFLNLLTKEKGIYCLMRKSDFLGLDESVRRSLLLLKEDERKVLLVSQPW